MADIEEQSRAAHAALYDLREGEVRHTFITKRMERTQDAASRLIALIGDDAVPLIVAAMEAV